MLLIIMIYRILFIFCASLILPQASIWFIIFSISLVTVSFPHHFTCNPHNLWYHLCPLTSHLSVNSHHFLSILYVILSCHLERFPNPIYFWVIDSKIEKKTKIIFCKSNITNNNYFYKNINLVFFSNKIGRCVGFENKKISKA
jgi:hypothetical protein